MSSESDLASLIGAIYEAGADFSLWPYALARVADAFKAPSAGITRQGATPSECWGMSTGVEQYYEQKYIEHYHSVNLIWQRSSTTVAGTVQTDTMVIPRGELRQTEFFNDFLAPQQMESQLNAVVLMEQGRQTVVAVRRNEQFDAHDVELYKIIAPHLQRAVELNIRLARAELNHSASLATLDQLDDGIIFVDMDAKVHFVNKPAEQYFADRDLCQVEGRLHTTFSNETAMLHAFIGKCCSSGIHHRSGDLFLARRAPGKSPLRLVITALTTKNSIPLMSFKPMAAIVITDPDKVKMLTLLKLRDKFGLTPAEASFAAEIVKGDGIQAAANRLSVSRATARTHLSRIFDKTGTRRQAELVGMLLTAKSIVS